MLFGRIPNIWFPTKNVLFSLLMYTRITIYGLVKKSVIPLFIFWITFSLGFELNFIGKLLAFRWGTNCAPLVADLFLFCYERDFMKSLSRENHADIIEAFNSTSRYLDDLLNIDNIYFDQMVDRIYPTELPSNKTNSSDTEAFFFLEFESISDLIIPGLVTNGTAKICCLGLILALFCSTVVIKNDFG